MKFGSKKIILMFGITSLLPLSTSSFLSCLNKQNDDLSFGEKVYYSSSTKQQIPFTVNNKNISSIFVKIVGSNTKYIAIKTPLIKITNEQPFVEIELDNSSSNDPVTANFSLQFTLLDNNLKSINRIEIDDFTINFRGHEHKEIDEIEYDRTPVVVAGEYHTKIDFILGEEIKSDIHLTLHSNKSEISLRENIIKPVKDPSPSRHRWFATVNFELALSLYRPNLFDFDLTFDFINSFGKKQTSTIKNLVIKFFKSEKKEIPDDYYVIENNVLTGFKKGISIPRIVESCETIKIPDGVVKIEAGVFGKNNIRALWNINKISIPASVQKIEDHAFDGVINLYEVDISSYKEDEIPLWMVNSLNIFAGQNLLRPLGYVWTSRFDYDEEVFTKYLVPLGLTNKWIGMRYDMVTPDDLFETKETTNENGDGVVEITGVTSKYADWLWYFSIIRIPKKATSISEFAFKQNFGQMPYFEHGLSTKAKTRRLFIDINSKLKSVKSYSFQNAGIGGPLYLPILNADSGNNATNIFSTYWIDNIGSYLNEVVKPTVEPIEIIFEQKFVDTEIPDYFITTTDASKYNATISKIVFPPMLKRIGNHAFSFGTFTGKIEFPDYVEEIGDSAFTNYTINDEFIVPKELSTIGDRAFSYHKIKTLTFKCFEYKPNPDDPTMLDIVQLEHVGGEAFGSESDEQKGIPPGNNTIQTIDLSMYPIANPNKGETTIIEVPPWLTDQANNGGKPIFAHACDLNGGVVYVSKALKDKNDVFVKLKEALKKQGVPIDDYLWKIEVKG